MKLIVFAIICSIAALTCADNWGSFESGRCVGDGLRQYSSVLEGIPSGESWESHCVNGPKAVIEGQTFDRPSSCVNAGPGINIWGFFVLIDASCLNMGKSALDDVKSASSVNKGEFALNDMKLTDNGIMPQGNQLGIGAALQSANKRFRLDMQSDGNLVLYKEPEHRPIWHTDTVGRGGFRANLQHDGNFVLYTESSVPIWNSRTFSSKNFLMLQDDGNLVIYEKDFNALSVPLHKYAQWSTGTAGMKKATNLRTESFSSASVANIGATKTQESLPYTLADIVHVDNGPHSAGDVAVGASYQASSRALDGIN
jgi:hypothetical protein